MKKQPLKLNNKRWAMYAVAGATAAFAGAGTAEADITHVVLDNGDGDVGLGGALMFDLGNGSTLNFTNSSYTYASYPTNNNAGVGVTQGDGEDGGVAFFRVGNFVYGSNVASGVSINSSTLSFIEQDPLFLAYGSGGDDAFDAGVEGFLAFEFNGGTQFGWARVTFDEDAATDTDVNTFVVNEYAFASADKQIAVGQTASVPEPTSLGLLALGAVGVLANRRRKLIA